MAGMRSGLGDISLGDRKAADRISNWNRQKFVEVRLAAGMTRSIT